VFGAIIIGILIVLVIVNVAQYFFSINVTAIFKNFMSEKPEIDVIVKQPPPHPNSLHSKIKEYQKEQQQKQQQQKEQVFNIPGNYYNYDNAKALCSAYGANLATYEQVEDSYQNGGEWCNYGWSDGQMALFPTQQSTFNTLQDTPGHEHDCGRPGINGGYIANPNVRFGVNCYGTKPAITQEEETLMDTTPQYPQSAEDIAFQQRVNFWKNNIDNILISPFNQGNWDFSNNNNKNN
jgi:hypothetical protein